MSPRPLRVLYALGYGHRMAGSQRSLLETLRHLPETIHPIVALTSEGPVADAYRDRGLEVHVVQAEGGLGQYGKAALSWSWPTKIAVGIRRYLPYALSVRAFLRRHEIELVHANDPRAALLFGAAARTVRIPTVTHLRGEVAIPPAWWHAVELLSDRVITVSGALQAGLTDRGRRRSTTVYNGTNLIDAGGNTIPWLAALRGAGIPVVCCFASVVPYKGYHHLVDAIVELARRGWGERAAFVAVGDIPAEHQRYSTWLFEKIARADVRNLTFAGWQHDPFAFYRSADLTVLPSVSREALAIEGEVLDVVGNEGFPRTHLEAMAAGLPVVGTDIAGVREQVDHGRTGFIVPPADPLALADAIEALLADETKRRDMGAAGRVRVQRLFSIEACVSGVLRTYESLVPGRIRADAR